MRVKFFRWSATLTSCMIGGNFLLFGYYLWSESTSSTANIPESVMLAWIGATVVEIIGVVTIIATHLFPGKKWAAARAKSSSK